jgi:hypothetical protein
MRVFSGDDESSAENLLTTKISMRRKPFPEEELSHGYARSFTMFLMKNNLRNNDPST